MCMEDIWFTSNIYEKDIGILISSNFSRSQPSNMWTKKKKVGGGRNLKAELVFIHSFIYFYLMYILIKGNKRPFDSTHFTPYLTHGS